MIGAIIGDIVGSVYEFDNTDSYDFELYCSGSNFTDDTICTVAVADAAMSGDDYQSCLQRWCRRYPQPKGAYGGYFAQWIVSPDPQPYNSYGNGSAMRVSPVAWLFDTEEEVRRQACASAAVTHNHPEGEKGAEATATAIFRMRKASEKTPEVFENVAREFYGSQPFAHLPAKGVFDVTCQGCVPLSLLIAMKARDFEDAIRLAVSYGGDTDTVGAIVGSLAEARFGVPAHLAEKAKSYLPTEMLAIVDRFELKVKR